MKKHYCLVVLLQFFLAVNVKGQFLSVTIPYRLDALLKAKNYFTLNAELPKLWKALPVHLQLYYQAHCAMAFNNKPMAARYADALLKKYSHKFSDTALAKMLRMQADNYVNLYQYNKAAAVFQTLVTRYYKLLDSTELASIQNSLSLFQTIAGIPPQRMHKNGDVRIMAYRNRFNHLMTPVRSGKDTAEFIFDTGANLSAVSESYAKKMGFKIYESAIHVGTSTQKSIQTKLAVADSFYVGDILFEQVVFLVTQDEDMNFPQLNYQVKGIIGFPVISQMGEVRMYKNGTILVPAMPITNKLSNLYLDGLSPVVQVISGADTLLFTLDTGAKNSKLSQKYYEDHKAAIEKNGTLKLVKNIGGGGQMESNVYELSNFELSVGSKTAILGNIPVALTKLEFLAGFDGNLGQDFFTKFNALVINFNSLYIDFE